MLKAHKQLCYFLAFFAWLEGISALLHHPCQSHNLCVSFHIRNINNLIKIQGSKKEPLDEQLSHFASLGELLACFTQYYELNNDFFKG